MTLMFVLVGTFIRSFQIQTGRKKFSPKVEIPEMLSTIFLLEGLIAEHK